MQLCVRSLAHNGIRGGPVSCSMLHVWHTVAPCYSKFITTQVCTVQRGARHNQTYGVCALTDAHGKERVTVQDFRQATPNMFGKQPVDSQHGGCRVTGILSQGLLNIALPSLGSPRLHSKGATMLQHHACMPGRCGETKREAHVQAGGHQTNSGSHKVVLFSYQLVHNQQGTAL
jgi:hypothetical protein